LPGQQKTIALEGELVMDGLSFVLDVFRCGNGGVRWFV
jgi:hypothetical protein